jgi:hypothetical protein
MALPSPSGAPTLVGPVDGASLYRWSTEEVHLRTREEPSLETLWFKNKETMEKVQNLKVVISNLSIKRIGYLDFGSYP